MKKNKGTRTSKKVDAAAEPGTVPGQSAASMLLMLGKEKFCEHLLNAARTDLDRYVLGITGKAPHKTRTDAQVIAALARWAEGDKNWTMDEPPPPPINPKPQEKISVERKTREKKAKTPGEKKPRKPGVCAFIAEHLKAKEDTETILKGIRAQFPDSKASSRDVAIIRSKVNQGLM